MFKNRKAEALEKVFNDAARLVSIDRNGRMIVFTFIRNGQAFTIETMGLLSDNVSEWREKAGL